MKSLTRRLAAGILGMITQMVPCLSQAQPSNTAQAATLTVGILVSSTGPAASVGVTQRNAVSLLPKEIGKLKANYVLLDDASDTSTTVKLARKLLTEDHIDVLIGPSLTPNSLAIVDVVSEARTPMISLGGSGSIVEPVGQREWVFKTPQSDQQMATAIVQHMVESGVKTIGFVGFNDAYGEGWWREFSKLAELRKLRVVANERFVRTDTSVTGQILKVMATNPDAVFIAASGTPAALPQTTLVDRGFKGKIYQTHGVANADFLRVGGRSLEGTFVPASPVLVAEQLPDSHPSKAIAVDFVKRYETAYGPNSRSAFAAYLYDAVLILNKAVPVARKAGEPGSEVFRSALRAAIEQATEVVGNSGVYNLSPRDHLGLDQRSRVMIQIRGGKWVLAESL